MLRTDKTIYKVILVLNLLFIILCMALSVVDIGDANLIRVIYRVINIICLLFALFYILYGYRKNAAGYYKTFGFLYIVAQTICLISTFINTKYVIAYVFHIASLLILLVLCLGKDLGKNVSLVLCGILAILKFADCISWFSKVNAFDIVLKTRLTDFILASIYGILTYAKYLDKAERGTK